MRPSLIIYLKIYIFIWLIPNTLGKVFEISLRNLEINIKIEGLWTIKNDGY